jgi:hypothetical protein
MARDRGEGDADAVLEALSADQVAELVALEELEPRGPNRDDLRFARLACWLISAIPFRGKDAQQPKEEDIFATLRRDPLAGRMTGQEIGMALSRNGVKRAKDAREESMKRPAKKPLVPKSSRKPPKGPPKD